LERLNKAGLKIKVPKLVIGARQASALGHKTSSEGISPDPAKVKSISDCPTPTSTEALQTFLGMAGFLHPYVRHYAEIAGPLHELVHATPFVWSELHEKHFNLLKNAIARAPLLHYPDMSLPFHVATDASNTGIGGVLYQPRSPNEPLSLNNIVEFHSRKLTQSEKNYSPYKKELLAVVECLRRFHSFLWGHSPVVIETDHKPLVCVHTSDSLSPALAQWLDVLLEYNFTVVHKPGRLNIVPDALSRMYLDSPAWGIPAQAPSTSNVRVPLRLVNAANDEPSSFGGEETRTAHSVRKER
jgi:hypothetical protein